MGFELACGLTCVWLVAVGLAAATPRQLYGGVAFAALAPVALGPLTLHRYDLWAAALCTAGVVFTSGAALGAGTVAKIFPAVVLPLAYLRRRSGGVIVSFVVALVAIAGAFVVLAPGGVRFSLARQTGRALQLETLGSSALLAVHAAPRPTFGSGSWNLDGALPDALAALQTVAQVGAVVLVWILFARTRRGRDEFVLAAAAAVAAWLTLGKVLSPQFLLWLVPLVALLGSVRVGAALVAALALTQAVYPDRYDALVRREGAPIALLALRNAILVGIVVALVVLLHRERVPEEVRAERYGEDLREPVLLDGGERQRPDGVPRLEP